MELNLETPKRTLADALSAASELLEGFGGKSVKVGDAANALRELAQTSAIEKISIADDLYQRIVPSESKQHRGISFLRRPSWTVGGVEGRDLCPFSAQSNGDMGWRKPTTDDGARIACLEQFLRAQARIEVVADGDGEKENDNNFLDPELVKLLNDIDLAPDSVLMLEPAFLPGLSLMHLEIKSGLSQEQPWEGLFFSKRDKEGELEVDSFDYSSEMVHRLNREIGIQIAGNEINYLRYFLQIVRGDEGTFRVIGTDLKNKIRDVVGDADKVLEGWHPLRFVGANYDCGLLYTAYVLYAGAVFQSTFNVTPDGQVGMVDDISVSAPNSALRED